MKKENLEKIIELRHTLHAHPELSMQEVWTKNYLMSFIKENTRLSVVDCGKWFYAFYKCPITDNHPSPDKDPILDREIPIAETIAFRADFDGLPMDERSGLPYASVNPGVCHKCGHDGHSAVLAGLALELDQRGADKNICLIFQHGEEIGAGGEECAQIIPELGISKVYAFHNMSGYPEKSVILKSGVVQCTSKGFTVKMVGTPAHASQPEDGKNPAAAIAELTLYQAEATRKNSYRGFVLSTVVHVEIGTKNFGISASTGQLSMTLRADYEEDLNTLEHQIRSKAEALGETYGLAVSYEETDFFPETVNDETIIEEVRKAAQHQNLQLIDMEHSFRASEDFGYYLKKCPGAIFYIGNGESYPPIHTSEFDFHDGIMETAVDLFAILGEIHC